MATKYMLKFYFLYFLHMSLRNYFLLNTKFTQSFMLSFQLRQDKCNSIRLSFELLNLWRLILIHARSRRRPSFKTLLKQVNYLLANISLINTSQKRRLSKKIEKIFLRKIIHIFLKSPKIYKRKSSKSSRNRVYMVPERDS